MFRQAVVPSSGPEARPLFFAFVDGQLLVREHTDSPELSDIPTELPAPPLRRIYLGELDDRSCYAVELPGKPENDDALRLSGLRGLMGSMDDELFRVAGIASQILDWDRDHAFCGRCGAPTVASPIDRSRTCPKCSLSAYPRISPAIIVAVLRGETILLARNRRNRTSGIMSVIAGFVEPGESLEDTVRREIKEEVNVEVSGIRYFASQPWPFPNSLMIAFVADWAGGTIRPDGVEIMDAGWFDRDNLPAVPPPGTVARRLIDWFVEQVSQRKSE